MQLEFAAAVQVKGKYIFSKEAERVMGEGGKRLWKEERGKKVESHVIEHLKSSLRFYDMTEKRREGREWPVSEGEEWQYIAQNCQVMKLKIAL